MSTMWVDMLGCETRFYDARGVRTRAIESGQGDAVILLHGIGGHAEAFARNIVPMAEKHRVISLDYLGFGLTDTTAQAPTAQQYVRHLVDFMDAAGIERAHLVGESLGGWVAFWTAIQYPGRVRSLVSVCGARLDVETDPESVAHAQRGLAELRRLTEQFVADPSRETVRQRLNWLFKNPDRDVTEELVDLRWSLYQRAERLAQLRSTFPGGAAERAVEENFTPERLAAITHPTLMLWTSDNPTITAATAERATRYLPDAKFQLLQDCGHWPQWEAPEAFNRAVLEFLANPQ